MSLIALFGGTFDPVHLGHLRCALEVAEALDAPVRLLPCHTPVHRDPPRASPQQRWDMLTRAVAGQDRLEADDREIRRGGSSWMIDTLESHSAENPPHPRVLVVGADAFAHLDRWRRWQEIFDHAHLAVISRPGPVSEPSSALKDYLADRESDAVDELRSSAAGRYLRIPVSPLAISSSDIRQRIASGLSARFLIPESVSAYIEEHQLYREA